MKIGIIIQARMSSTRLPGKVLKKLAGREMLWHVVQRCRQAKKADTVIVATSTDASDDQIQEFCEREQVEYCRGDLNNVLKRFAECARKHSLDTIVRVTSDCPFIDPQIIDDTLVAFETAGVDFVSNSLHRSFPRGLDAEVFSAAILEEAHVHARTEEEKEHVTPYITSHAKTMAFEVPHEYEGNFRLTVDEQRDYELAVHLYERFFESEKSIIDVKHVIDYLHKNPDVAAMNTDVQQKASLIK